MMLAMISMLMLMSKMPPPPPGTHTSVGCTLPPDSYHCATVLASTVLALASSHLLYLLVAGVLKPSLNYITIDKTETHFRLSFTCSCSSCCMCSSCSSASEPVEGEA